MMNSKEVNLKVDTRTLFNMLFKTSSITQFIQKNANEMQLPTFGEYIVSLCKKQGKVAEHIIKRGDIERSFGHQLFKGRKKPSRDTVIQLAFGFEADLEMAQELLKHAGMSALYPRIKRDAVIIYCLHNNFSITETQNILYELKIPLIGGMQK